MILAQTLIDQYLALGDVSGFIIAIYTSVMGDVFFGLLFLGFTVPIYQRTQSISFVSLLWFLAYGLLEILIPTPGLDLGKIIMAISIGVILYNTLMRGS